MALTTEEVRRVALLARLRLSEPELERMREQLSSILDYIAMLREVDVTGVPPTAQVTELTTVMRGDLEQPSLPQAAALANAPDQQDGLFRVRAVFEE